MKHGRNGQFLPTDSLKKKDYQRFLRKEAPLS
jgi:hypothetical protein